MKTELAKSETGFYINFIVDVADQTKFSLPHFSTHTEDECGHDLTVHITGVLLYASLSQMRLFTIADDHSTSANHVI